MRESAGYVVNPSDNVATAISPLGPGAVRLTGARSGAAFAAAAIPAGHKFALRPIRSGEPVIKYGAVIGVATGDIAEGGHVHLHNVRSNFDEKSSALDCQTAMPTDAEYALY